MTSGLSHGVSPAYLKGWLVLAPKRHVESFHDLRPDEAAAFGPLAQTVVRAVVLALAPERVYLCLMAEAVQHVHFHVVPRYTGMPASGVKVLAAMFSDERPWAVTDEEAADAARRVRDLMG